MNGKNIVLDICYLFAKEMCFSEEAKSIVKNRFDSDHVFEDYVEINMGNGLNSSFNEAFKLLNNGGDISNLREIINCLGECGDDRCKLMGELIREFNRI